MFLHRIDESISLKVLQPQDAPELFQLTDASRAHLKEWLPWLDATSTEKDTEGFILSALKGFAENKSLTTGILYQGKLAGTAGFNSINWANKTAYIGYWLGTGFQGKGIMTKTASALTEYAFSDLHLNKVEIRAAEDNAKSRAVPERLGYTQEGKLRQAEWLYDHYVDHIVYGMLAEEWRKK
ncbi:GNAT family N-acetyltransferase [Bacillus lacus]|uniref:GNAT family N-acetyltransferase n=1 Tax=Metabacillus lacus TaxID=1983721 RepID=A0A7X2IXW2_9BACI|nr:GNAT family protein [Metabacillus lacus]MRX71823.1 GNAT family N-acetyltransferase [Metabacillus lacus]